MSGFYFAARECVVGRGRCGLVLGVGDTIVLCDIKPVAGFIFPLPVFVLSDVDHSGFLGCLVFIVSRFSLSGVDKIACDNTAIAIGCGEDKEGDEGAENKKDE